MDRRQDFSHSFDYLVWDPVYHYEKPFQIFSDIPPDSFDQRKTNLRFEGAEPEQVHDVRGEEELYRLDRHGFEYVKHTSRLTDDELRDSRVVEDSYYRECEEVLRQKLEGVDQVLVFDWRLRSEDTHRQHGQKIDYNDRALPFGPATNPHVDTSVGSVIDRVNLYFPEQAEHLLQGRVRFVNIWRPLTSPVRRFPLAICDGTTLDQSSLVEAHRIRRQFTGCTLFAMYQKGIKWYYMSHQTSSDILLFKNFDSAEGVAKYAAHTGVSVKSSPDVPPRESIEVRALVFTYPESHANHETESACTEQRLP